jgi:hypothetical protein
MIALLFWLLVGHALADYPLQGQSCPTRSGPGKTTLPWWLALTWHSLIHAGVVALLTSSMVFGLARIRRALADRLLQVPRLVR